MTANMANQVVWLDIPVHDLDRAIAFYSAVLGQSVHKAEGPGFALGVLPHEGDAVGGCLVVVTDGSNQPCATGPLVYLNANGRLDAAIAAVGPAGGQVIQPKHSIGPHGFRAVILDSEGNRLALHSATE